MSQADPSQTPIDMAALRQRQGVAYDLMRPGPGTPWEDRGTRGLIGAFFATCFMSLRSPARLFDSIRRPETPSDARTFAIICGVFWGLGWVITGAAWFHHLQNIHSSGLDSTTYYEGAGLQFVLAPIAIFFMLRLSSGVYYKMASGELASRFQPVLVVNIFAYAMGPSILAVIPFVGPPLALLWIFIVLVVAGRSRMRLKMGSAIVDALLSLAASVVLFIIAYLVGWLIWNQLYGASPDLPPPSTPLPH